MSREIKNGLLNLQEYLIVGKTSPSGQQKSQKKCEANIRKNRSPFKLQLGSLNTLTGDELRSALIYQLRIIQND